jgi:hypothetical protein
LVGVGSVTIRLPSASKKTAAQLLTSFSRDLMPRTAPEWMSQAGSARVEHPRGIWPCLSGDRPSMRLPGQAASTAARRPALWRTYDGKTALERELAQGRNKTCPIVLSDGNSIIRTA